MKRLVSIRRVINGVEVELVYWTDGPLPPQEPTGFLGFGDGKNDPQLNMIVFNRRPRPMVRFSSQ